MNDEFDFDDISLDNLSDDALMDMVCNMDMVGDVNISDEENSDGVRKCSLCNGTEIITDEQRGIVVCSECGQVQDLLLNENPEWRSYANDEGGSGVSRCSGPSNVFLPQSSLGTSIGGNKRGKLQTLNSWTQMPYKEKSLHIVLKEIEAKCRKAGILKCIEDDAKIIYKKIISQYYLNDDNVKKSIIIRGTNRRSLIAACVLYACKRNKSVRSSKEIATLFGLNHKDITKGCKTFVKLIRNTKFLIEFKSSPPEDFVPRFCKQLKLKQKFIDQAVTIARNIHKLNIATTHTPLSVAAASILLTVSMNDLTITKRQLADKFVVSEVTITKAYKAIETYRTKLISVEKTDKIIEKERKIRSNTQIPEALKKKLEKIQQAKKAREVMQNGKFIECNLLTTDIAKYNSQISNDLNIINLDIENRYSKLNILSK